VDVGEWDGGGVGDGGDGGCDGGDGEDIFKHSSWPMP
jgi:hypothetical protein